MNFNSFHFIDLKDPIILRQFSSRYYISHSFLVDLIAALPMTEIYLSLKPLHTGGHDAITHIIAPHYRHCKWRLISLLQFHRVFRWFGYFKDSTCKSSKTMKFLKNTFILVLLINLLVVLKISFTCVYKFKEEFRKEPVRDVFRDPLKTLHYGKLVCQNELINNCALSENASTFLLPIIRYYAAALKTRVSDAISKYLVGIYGVTNFLTNTGLSGTCMAWMAGVMLLIFIGFLLFTHLISIVSTLFLEKETITIRHRKDVACLMEFLERNHVPKELKKQVLNHLLFEWEFTNGLDFISVLNNLNLNTTLTHDILLNQYEDSLKYSAFCSDLDSTTLRLLLSSMKLKLYKKGETIIRYKDITTSMYVIASGQVDILNEEKRYVTTIGAGGIFGNIHRNRYRCSPIYVMARRNVNLCMISTDQFFSIIKYHPQILQKLKASLFHDPSYIIPSSPDIESERDEDNFWKDIESDEESMPRSRSHSRIRSNLKCLQLCVPCLWFKLSITPNHFITRVLDVLTFWGSLINMFTIPYVFIIQTKGYLNYIDLCFEPVFLLRLLMKLHQAYFNFYGNLTVSNRKILQRYFNSPAQVFWDIIPNLPLCLLCFVSQDRFLLYSYLRLLHLLRFYYIVNYFKQVDRKLKLNYWLLIAELLTFYVILIHFLSCCWYMLACPFGKCNETSWIFHYDNNVTSRPLASKFLLSYYYILSTITLTGTGDILPVELNEVIFTVAVMVLGKLMTAILIGGILRWIYVSSIDLTLFEYKAKLLKTYLINKHLSSYQMERVWRYLQNLWRYKTECCLPKLVNHLPYTLKCDVMSSVYDYHLQDSFLFRNIDESLLKQICCKLEPVVFLQDDYIVKYGDTNSCMYFIHRGEVSVLTKHSDLTETQHVLLHPNDMFGVSQGVNQETVHHFTYRAASNVVEILVLCFDAWSCLLPFFPSDERLIFTRVQKSYTKM